MFHLRGQAPGVQVYGGTSVSSPIIASTYALAGTPVSGTYPNSYPYATPAALNDVTSGSNGSCGNSYLCTAVPGYDGLSLASIRARLRYLDANQLRILLEHEESASNRADFVSMLERRLAKIESGIDGT